MIKLSQSALNFWFEAGCPARWHFSRDWRLKQSSEPLIRGSQVHEMLAGQRPAEKTEDRYVLPFYNKIVDLLRANDLELIEPPELDQRFEIKPGVDWARVIDRLARRKSGELVMIDYKAGGSQWKRLENTAIVPQSLGTQAVNYLLPPPTDMPDELWPTKPEWPTTLWFVVASFRGPADLIPYHLIPDDVNNFYGLLDLAIAQIGAAKEAGWPKAYGKVCLTCEFRQMCFDLPGWRKLYVRKRKRNSKLHRKDNEPNESFE